MKNSMEYDCWKDGKEPFNFVPHTVFLNNGTNINKLCCKDLIMRRWWEGPKNLYLFSF